MKFKEPTILFRTIVGSHMWGQHHSESDTDMFECYVVDTRSILLGDRYDRGKKTKGDNWEKDSFEIGHIIEMLLKGNVNFLWGVMSPKKDLVATNIDPNIWDLRQIVMDNLSRATVHSIRGFATHNLKHWLGIEVGRAVNPITGKVRHYIKEMKVARLGPEDKKYWKIINTCARTLDFGIILLKNGFLNFQNPRGARTPGDIILLLNELEKAYEESPLPDKPDPIPFEDFLIAIRRREWLIDVIFYNLKINDMSIDEFCGLLKGVKDMREGNVSELCDCEEFPCKHTMCKR